jgi:hypothetical protein
MQSGSSATLGSAHLKDSRGGNVTLGGQPITAAPIGQGINQQQQSTAQQHPSSLQQAAVAQVVEVPVTYQNIEAPKGREKNYFQKHMNDWMGTEDKKIHEWKQSQLSQGHEKAGQLEKQLRQQAQEKQKQIEEQDRLKRENLFKQWDLEKQQKLRDVENDLQRNLQYELLKNKFEILQWENEANSRRFDMLRQGEMRTAADLDSLGQQFQQQTLQPSVTETTIITNTHPVKLNEQGTLDQPPQQSMPMQQNKQFDTAGQVGRPIDSYQHQQSVPGVSGFTGSGAGYVRDSDPSGRSHIDAAYGRDIPSSDHMAHASSKNVGIRETTDDDVNKRNTDRDMNKNNDMNRNDVNNNNNDFNNKHNLDGEQHQSRGLLGKVKDALGGNKHSEPTSTESTARRV